MSAGRNKNARTVKRKRQVKKAKQKKLKKLLLKKKSKWRKANDRFVPKR
jgi:hypothetical protein